MQANLIIPRHRGRRAVLALTAALLAPALARAAPLSPDFPLVSHGTAAPLFHDADDAAVVDVAERALAGDIALVTGRAPTVATSAPHGDAVVLAGTIGQSRLIDALVKRGRIDVREVRGQREAYAIAVVADPIPGVRRALVIAGADRRGTAYGVFRVSRMIGVSPWVWWADAVPEHRGEIALPAATIVQGSPSVRYRGIFINDEDWSLRPWASKTLDPRTGNIGPTTYARVFELLLRLRANLLWPAMHEGSVAFNQVPENAALAERYAIVMSSSHAEPMLRNNVAEWDTQQRGEYNYATNGPSVLRYWEERVKANGGHENIYDVGMRGIHDSAMVTGAGVDEVSLLDKVIADQRSLLRSDLGRDPATVPQLFVNYKEVLDLYRKGLTVPDDVTLGWVDDNYGYIRQLSTAAERRRRGGAGVYYHISYWGGPQDYLWLDTTPPALIGEEMGKAYATDARRMWILNVGDIKPGERGAEYFLDLAYDFDATIGLGQHGWLKRWAVETFGTEPAEAIASLMDEYYRLGFARKPEHMGWNLYELGVQHTELSPVAYGDEAARRLADYRALDARAAAIEAALPAEKRAAFYQLVLYPVRGSHLMNEKMLAADRSFLYAYQGRASANFYADRAAALPRAIHDATAQYNNLSGGKWRNFMNDAPRDLSVYQTPPVARLEPTAVTGLGIAVEGSVDAWTATRITRRPALAEDIAKWRTPGVSPDALPAFLDATNRRHFIDVFATGPGTPKFTATSSAPWIIVTDTQQDAGDMRLWVTIDWSKAPSTDARGEITIRSGAWAHRIAVSARRGGGSAGEIVEDDGVVAIPADHFSRLVEVGGDGWRVNSGLGRSGHALSTPATAASYNRSADAPHADYQFRTLTAGPARVLANLMPTFALDADHALRYAVQIDDAPPQIIDAGKMKDWNDAVVRNSMTSASRWILPAGEHKLRVYALDPGLVLDSLSIDMGGLLESYLGPPNTS